MDRRLFLLSIPAFAYAMSKEKPMTKAPALFISHGSPMNIIDDNAYTRDLKALGKKLEKPRAVLVISAHWIGRSPAVSVVEHPETIYDFYGFPDALYDVTYDASGGVDEAKAVAESFGFATEARGLDHGSWSVLHHLFPEHDVPVFQLRIDMTKPFAWHYQLGAELAILREHGIMVIGSGNVTHNLYDRQMAVEAPVSAWAREFHEGFLEGVTKDHGILIDAPTRLPRFAHAHPTVEHYIPLLPIMGSQGEGERVRLFHEGYQHGTLDMSSLIIS